MKSSKLLFKPQWKLKNHGQYVLRFYCRNELCISDVWNPQYCNFTDFRCSFILVFSVVNGFTKIKKTPKCEKHIERSRQHPQTPKFKLHWMLRDCSPLNFNALKMCKTIEIWGKHFTQKFSEDLLEGNSLRQDPLDLTFWSSLTFLHYGIEEVERHLLWKFHKNSKETLVKCAAEVPRLPKAPFTRRRCENESLRIVSDTIVFGQNDPRVFTRRRRTFKDAFVRSDDDVECLLSRVNDYKTSPGVDWDPVRLKHFVIRQVFPNVSKERASPRY